VSNAVLTNLETRSGSSGTEHPGRSIMKRFRNLGLAAVSLLLLVAVAVPVQAASNSFNAHLSGKDVVPVRETQATGQAKFTSNQDATQLQYRINVSNIENVVSAQVFLGAPGENGTAVAVIYGPAAPGAGKSTGVLTTGTLTAAMLTGSLAGQPLSTLIDAMKAGNAYVIVSTDDGQGAPDEKPGDFTSGEIRGQIR
jgi:CHRD domain-containing protein